MARFYEGSGQRRSARGQLAKPFGSAKAVTRAISTTLAEMARTIVVDFDGTITERDLLDAIAVTFGDPAVYREVDEGLDGNALTLHEVIRREFEPVTAPLEDVVDWVLVHARVRPGFHELVELARERGWRLVVLSSGFRELIEPVFEREGVGNVELLANAIDPDPSGWRVRFRDETVCDHCGQPCKRATASALANGSELVYVGDGYSDRCAADDADLVFARRGLAAYLDERRIPYTYFDDFEIVVATLKR
jgi:2-hydroxy-3-keto-5-methylthiopentenyl-1-phosphate phosphatase